ncbi:putative flavin-containing monoamine oxidase AofH [Gordonia spumicola]|uniref:Putative flavin-containing monoamine oxidase AofH n=1 Tax=Gordonia spumicola TaxID=589161 RepID=A0A7I9VCA1_9ACTN|nr:FAD-dependent oxidoreductase [Gordonia spumicola]GEE02914.1 putative flavin-containing monoamine oxidase AofH [Gordonia spumicola]
MTGLPDRADVVVIGAGLSGLVAARDLHRAGLDVHVIEAADRVGGRAYAVTSNLGSRLDLGGQWVGAGHDRLLALAAELGCTVYPMESPSMPAIVDRTVRVRPWSVSVLGALAAVAAVEVMSRTGVPARWRDRTLGEAIAGIPGARTRRLLTTLAGVSSTAELDKFTVGAMASTVRRMGGAAGMLSSKGGAQESLIVEGAGRLAELIAADLGDGVRLGDPAVHVSRDDDGVTVRTRSGAVVRAGHAVIAVPPPVAARIEHQPGLPHARVDCQDGMRMGSVYKAVVVYPTPFWRSGGPAETVVLGETGIGVFDSTSPAGPGHLTVLVGGTDARVFDDLTVDQRRARVLDALGGLFGDEARAPADFHDKVWQNDEHVGGGYLALPLPGAAGAALPADSTPCGRVHWAGTETSDDHPGYLEGAICAGRRAASEIIDLRR